MSSSKESSKDKPTSKTNDNTGKTDTQSDKSKDPCSTGKVTYISAEDYENPESEEDIDIFCDTEDPTIVDAEDDYDKHQDRLQIKSIDKNKY